MELIRDEVKLELEDLGEGLSGEFDANDPSDTPLLRLSVYVRGKLRTLYEETYGSGDSADGWAEIPKSSYCTSVVATASEDEQKAFLQEAMRQLYQLVLVDRHRRVLQQLTWDTAEAYRR